MCVFLWRPIFTGRALLPGDYLMQLSPWKTVQTKVESPDSQHPELVEGSGNPQPQWNPLQWDAIAQFYPWRVFYARSMKSGHIPLWNPHQFSGTPFLANGQSACLYPPNLVFLLFNPITAFTILAALHLFLAQLFMYWLMRDLGAKELGGIVAAITFAFSAFMVLWLELPTFISVAVWLPLALLLVHRAVERRSGFCGMLSGLVLGVAFLAGHFQIAFYVVLATGLWWLWKMVGVWRAEGKTYTVLKVIWPLIGCIVIAGLIAAPQMLPTQELAANSHRVRAVTEEGYQSFISNAVPVCRLVTAFAPKFFGTPSQGDYYYLEGVDLQGHYWGSAADYMEYGMYAGILPLMLALIALGLIKKKHVSFFAVLTALALLTALGTPINRLFYFGIPGFSALGGPNRILLLYLFGIAALAGFGADWMAEEPDANRHPKLIFITAVFLVISAVFLACFRVGMGVAGQFSDWATDDYCVAAAALAHASLLLLGGAILIGRLFDPKGRTVFSAVVVLFIIADLFAFGINYNPTCERSQVYPKTKLTTELKRLTKNGERIAPINPKWSLFETPKDAILPPNAAMVYGLYDIQGYDSLYTRSYQSAMARVEGMDPSPPENGNMVLVKQCTRDVAKATDFVISRRPLDGLGTGVISCLQIDGLYISRVRNMPDKSSITLVSRDREFWKRTDSDCSGPNRMSTGSWITKLYNVSPSPSRTWFGQIARTSGEAPNESDIASSGTTPVTLSFEPFTFRLGLFLMLIGVGAISCVGVYRLQRSRIGVKR